MNLEQCADTKVSHQSSKECVTMDTKSTRSRVV
jgi:hypothetical protein